MTPDQLVGTVTNTIYYLHHHKPEIIHALFSNATRGYQEKWTELDAFSFWAGLDQGNRKRVVDMAREEYR